MANESNQKVPQGITAITVSGFKSLRDESRIEVRPLTILAGANSSGKSSIMQPLLLMKQTLEAPYDPGALLLKGPNVIFTEAAQFLTKVGSFQEQNLEVTLEVENERQLTCIYGKSSNNAQIELVKTSYHSPSTNVEIAPDTTHDEIIKQFPASQRPDAYQNALRASSYQQIQWKVVRQRCFLEVGAFFEDGASTIDLNAVFTNFPVREYVQKLSELIRVRGLRGTFERIDPFTPVTGPNFQGIFVNYTASIMLQWQEMNDKRFDELRRILGRETLRLTSTIVAKRREEIGIEIYVGRTLNSDSSDTVHLSDVGLGILQIIPVLVALLVAEPGQLVYIEQPELHLHPRAQVALAQVLADAANRGVRVVAETHSALLIEGIQTLVAQEKISSDKIMLHWFARDEDGCTKISSQELNKFGAYSDFWPEDFAEVQLEADSAYLDAVENRRLGELNGGQKPEMSGD